MQDIKRAAFVTPQVAGRICIVMLIRWRNHTKRRYYVAHLTRDLLGHWILVRVWGSEDSAHGRMMQTIVADGKVGTLELQKITRRRAQRGYVKTFV
jgi:hypothetical protein